MYKIPKLHFHRKFLQGVVWCGVVWCVVVVVSLSLVFPASYDECIATGKSGSFND